MNTEKPDAATQTGVPIGSREAGRSRHQTWFVVTSLIVAAVFLEAVFAGAMWSGAEWARRAHTANAGLLIASTIAACLVSLVTLRRIAHGPRLGLVLLALAAAFLLQAAIGIVSTKGANLAWLHVPLGASLVGLAMQATHAARRLGRQ
jgi:hypothetical protein